MSWHRLPHSLEQLYHGTYPNLCSSVFSSDKPSRSLTLPSTPAGLSFGASNASVLELVLVCMVVAVSRERGARATRRHLYNALNERVKLCSHGKGSHDHFHYFSPSFQAAHVPAALRLTGKNVGEGHTVRTSSLDVELAHCLLYGIMHSYTAYAQVVVKERKETRGGKEEAEGIYILFVLYPLPPANFWPLLRLSYDFCFPRAKPASEQFQRLPIRKCSALP